MRYLFIYYNNPMATNFIFVPQGSMTPIAQYIWNFLKMTLVSYNIWSSTYHLWFKNDLNDCRIFDLQFDLIWVVKAKFQFKQDPPVKEASNSDKPILFNIQGSKAEKREFRARQKAKFIGGQHEAFQDRDDGPYFH